MENLYAVLCSDENASYDVLKKCYQELVLKHHPDKNQNDGASSSDVFIKVNRAWKILSDPTLREQYDVRWNERCLAQTYPIQDTVEFDDFEEVESQCENASNKCSGDTSSTSGRDSARSCEPSHDGDKGRTLECVASQGDSVLSQSRDSESKGNNCCGNVFASHEDNNSESKGENCMDHDWDSLYSYPCRCGGSHILTAADIQMKFDIVCCDSCSLSIQVVYGDEET